VRRRVGAIFTMGVALVGATTVVANPVSAPPSDVRLPAVKLSADSATSSGALDRALLDALAQDPAQSSPADLFKGSVAGVVTSLTLFSGRVVEGVREVQPVVGGTPVRIPSPPPSVPRKAVADLLAGKPAVAANGPATPVDPAALQHAVSSVADYVGFVSVQAVDAVDAAGPIAAATPKRIVDTLGKLTRGDVNTAITAALRAVAAPLGQPAMAVKAIRTEVRKQLTELADRLRRVVPRPPRIGPQITRRAPVDRTTSLRSALGHRRGSVVTTKPTGTNPAGTKPAMVNGATDLTDGNKVVPHKRAPQSQLRQRVEASLNEVRDSLERLGDALRKFAPPPKLSKLPPPPKLTRPNRSSIGDDRVVKSR